MKRYLTAIVYASSILLSILLSEFLFLFAFSLLGFFTLKEFLTLIQKNYRRINTLKILSLCVLILLINILYILKVSTHSIFILIPIFFVLFLVSELYSKSEEVFLTIVFGFFSMIYILLPFVLFLHLAFIYGEYNYQFPLLLFFMIWFSDSGAYLLGKSIGKTPLFKRHSPNKTMEGFVGGLIGVLIVAFCVNMMLETENSISIFVLAVIVHIFAVFGDLFESMIKRTLNIKDSGTILAGHGGWLDRMDSFLFVTPAAYTYLYFIL